MKPKPVLVGTAAYAVTTFPLTVVWHTALFKSMYEEFGYFGGEPDFVAGFLSILAQGVLLSYGFRFFAARLGGNPAANGLQYAFLAGAFCWTCHVLAFTAKTPKLPPSCFIFLNRRT